MSSADDPGADPEGSGQTDGVADEQVHSQLVEALVLLLIEKGVLTKNDAMSIVQTVAQVQHGKAVEGTQAIVRRQAAMQMLRRMFTSVDALVERSGAVLAVGEHVHQLRPPIYGERPEFPIDD